MSAIICPRCGVVDSDDSKGWRKVRLCWDCRQEEAREHERADEAGRPFTPFEEGHSR